MSEAEAGFRASSPETDGTYHDARMNGRFFLCPFCNEKFYRKASFIKRGITKTCGKRSCISQSMLRDGNPFWRKIHSPEVREALKKARAAREGSPRPRKKREFPAENYHHTPEARAAIAEATRRRWRENRDVMLANNPPKTTPREEARYRRNFSPWQRKNWKGDKCQWCSSTEDLALDHIVPVVDGGFNCEGNAQTLCQPCNLWKSTYIDRPAHLARLALQAAKLLTAGK